MIVVGIVGGIASGKSLVTDHLKSLGAFVLDADRIGHEVLRYPDVKFQIRQQWGDSVFTPDGEVDRAKLGELVFDPSNRNELRRLEQITHPHIEEQLQNQIEQIRRGGRSPMIVLDAAIMVKTGWYRLCDEILFVQATDEIRRARALQRGWSAEKLARREAMQAPVEDKRKLSTILIDNNGTKEETHQQIMVVWRQLVGDVGP